MPKTSFTVDKENLEVRTERVFNAPREKVWQAYTDPAQIPQWWGPAEYATTVDTMDVKVGGAWRFVQKEKDGTESAFSGVYQEVVAPERLSYTFIFEPIGGDGLLETVTFEDQDGKTKVVAAARYATLEDLEGMVESGMESGAVESYERLAKLVE